MGLFGRRRGEFKWVQAAGKACCVKGLCGVFLLFYLYWPLLGLIDLGEQANRGGGMAASRAATKG